MSYSTDCLIAALDTWLGPLLKLQVDLNPFDDGSVSLAATLEEDLGNPARLAAKTAAGRYGLKKSESDLFDTAWELSGSARAFHRNLEGVLDTEVHDAFTRLAALVKGDESYDLRGYRNVLRMPGTGRFVIFSDHHMAPANNRQGFFLNSGNADLYQAILAEYAQAGFTLVENGDVEELIIREPDPGELESILNLQMTVNQADLDDPGWAKVDRLRLDLRLDQLGQILADHRGLYDQINRDFVEKGRYIRIAGNHDQDLQDEDQAAGFLAKLQEVYPKLQRVYDFVVLEGKPTYVICHGHHFDKSANPAFSRRIGESLSQYLGWAYQGADRVWNWTGSDGVQPWADGTGSFNNSLVLDDPSLFHFTFGDVVAAAFLGAFGAAIGAALGRPIGLALGGAAGVTASLVDELQQPAIWEWSFGHPIAWEYFQNEDPGEAVLEEVFCGKRWFKFRHLNEQRICEEMAKAFPENPPTLILGHSHEPRHDSWNEATGDVESHYLNSGAAGRFQNLIWCVEIIDGVPQVAAWHRTDGPQLNLKPNDRQKPERRIYTPTGAGVDRKLQGSADPVDLPAPADDCVWLDAVLRMMMR